MYQIALVAASLALVPGAHASSNLAVGPQYDSTHVYVAAADLDRFIASFVATFGSSRHFRIPSAATS
jgi:hypothetical protein